MDHVDTRRLLKHIQERRADCIERYKSVLLIPGGMYNQAKTMDTILDYVRTHQPSPPAFFSWLRDRFRCSPTTALNTLYILERANLLMRSSHATVVPTVDSKAYIKTRDPLLLARGFFDAFWGFWEALEATAFYQKQYTPVPVSRIYPYWREAFAKDHGGYRNPVTDNSQLRYVLAYSTSFGIISTVHRGSAVVLDNQTLTKFLHL